jgi:small subunit ribosomal protein S8
MSSDPIGDFLAALNNANHKRLERVDIPASNVKREVARVLKEEGYIADYKVLPDRRQGVLRVTMKYMPDKTRAILGIKRVSRPGLRIYRGYDHLPRVNGGLGVSLVSTSQGIMTDRNSRKKKLGGEVLGYIW